MLTLGNSKLGPWIHGWSIPAKSTCPGASGLCQRLCYAAKGHFRWRTTQASHRRNLRTAKHRDFAAIMNHALRENHVKILRVHVAGDFFNARYVRRWIKIVRANRRVRFFAYTRSWRRANMLPALTDLGREPNFQLWFSWDRETGPPPRRKGIRRAFMMLDDQDQPKYAADLTFRVRRDTVMKKDARGSLVCCAENGVTDVTCSRCKICWTESKGAKTPKLLQLT